MELIKALWTQQKVAYHGRIYQLENETMGPKPVQKPHPPIWLGGGHPDAVSRAATMADGWMGSGGSSKAEFAGSLPIMRQALENAARPENVSDLEAGLYGGGRARRGGPRELLRWFTTCTTIRRGRTPAASMARRSRCASAWKRSSQGRHHLMLNPGLPPHRTGRGAGGDSGARIKSGELRQVSRHT